MFLPVPRRQSASSGELSTDPGGQPRTHCPFPEKDGDRRPRPVRFHGQTRFVFEWKWHKFAVPTKGGGWVGGYCLGEEVQMNFACVAVWVQSAMI